MVVKLYSKPPATLFSSNYSMLYFVSRPWFHVPCLLTAAKLSRPRGTLGCGALGGEVPCVEGSHHAMSFNDMMQQVRNA